MKIGIVSPYFDSLGGGERYMLSIASHVSGNHSVDVFWDDPDLLQNASKRLNINLKDVRVVPNIFLHGSLLSRIWATRAYDVLFVLTDGSVPISGAKHTVLHMQSPLAHVSMPFWKKWRCDAVIYNSKFTKNHADVVLSSLPSRVVYPPVTAIPISKASKSPMILSVGRFGGLYNAKKFDVLIEAFKKLISKKQYGSYTLALAGGVLHSDRESFELLKKHSSKLPIKFYPNCSYDELISLYEQSVVYWHAAGFGETNPEHMEHFGISTVEAMSAKSIPIVYNGGGLPEIITQGENGYLWTTTDELIQKTCGILESNTLQKEVSDRASASAITFSAEAFNRGIDSLLRDVVTKRHI